MTPAAARGAGPAGAASTAAAGGSRAAPSPGSGAGLGLGRDLALAGGLGAGAALSQTEPTWRSALAFREERSRRRRRTRAMLLIGSVFTYGILQVWLSTETAETGSRVSQLQREASRLEEEITVARAQLAGRQLYGDLIGTADRGGFEPGAQRRVLWVRENAPADPPSLWRQMTRELERGSKLILDEALAQDRRPEGRPRAFQR